MFICTTNICTLVVFTHIHIIMYVVMRWMYEWRVTKIELKSCPKNIGGTPTKKLDFLYNKYICLVEEKKWKNELFFLYKERLHTGEGKKPRVRNTRICLKKIKRWFSFLCFWEYGWEEHFKICFIYNFYLKKTCLFIYLFVKHFALVSWPTVQHICFLRYHYSYCCSC